MEEKKKTAWRKRRKWILPAVVLLAGGVFAVRLAGTGKTAPQVNVITPVRETIQEKLTVSGPVSGTDSVDVVSSLHAEVKELLVKEGDRVEAGQTLAVLDDKGVRREAEMARNEYDLAVTALDERNREVGNGYEKARQDFTAAQNQYNRIRVLYDGGSVPLVDLETAENSLNDARRQMNSFTVANGQAVAEDSYRLQIEKARFAYEKKLEELEETKITAPITGTVVRVNTKVGRFADQTGESHEPLFIIENLDVLEMEIQVSEYSIGKVKIGQQADIYADILEGVPVTGEVISISPTGEEKSGGSSERVIPTRIRIREKTPKLMAGITARAEIILNQSEDALCVPSTALISREGSEYVQAVRGGILHWLPVKIGVEGDLMTEVFPERDEVLDESTQLVAQPGEAYEEGMAVTAAGSL